MTNVLTESKDEFCTKCACVEREEDQDKDVTEWVCLNIFI